MNLTSRDNNFKNNNDNLNDDLYDLADLGQGFLYQILCDVSWCSANFEKGLFLLITFQVLILLIDYANVMVQPLLKTGLPLWFMLSYAINENFIYRDKELRQEKLLLKNLNIEKLGL